MTRKRCVVIGSGAAGMTAGILLARENYDVTVLEQHQVPGGLMHSFRRAFKNLPTGVHNIGCLDPHEILWRYLTYMGVYDRLALRRMSDACVLHLQYPEFAFKMPGEYGAYRERLLEMFPKEHDAIHLWMDEIQACVQHFPLYNCRYGQGESLPKSLLISVNERLEQLGVSRELHAALTGHSMLWGIASSECPLYIHYLVTDTLQRGAYRVNHDETSMGDAFAMALHEAGGQLLLRHEVTRIDCKDRAVRGVHANDAYFPADVVIYTGHPRQLPELCPPDAFRKSYKTRLGDLQDTAGTFGAAIQWEHPVCDASDYDVFLHRTLNSDDSHNQRLFNTQDDPRFIYLSGHPDVGGASHTVTLLTPMFSQEVAGWRGMKRARRGDVYEAKKADVAQRLIGMVERQYPHAKGKLNVLATFTPLTLEHYTRSPMGSTYGVKRTTSTMLASHVGPLTRVQGLLLAGQNIVLSGILGAVISGVLASQIAVGDLPLVKKIAEATAGGQDG